MTDLEALAARVEGARDVAAIAAGLTKAQRETIILLAEVLDRQAGDGLGTNIEDGGTLWMDEFVGRIAEVFGLDPDLPLDLAVRAHLTAGATHDR